MGIRNVLQSAYRRVDHKGHSSGFEKFLSRKEKKRIYRGRYEDPRSFLAALRKYQEEQIDVKIKAGENGSEEDLLQSFNRATLPSVFYYRNLSYRFAEQGIHPSFLGKEYINSETKEKMMLDIHFLDVTYRIIFVAYNTESLDSLVTAWLMYINSPLRNPSDNNTGKECSYNNRGFSVPYNAGFSLPVSFGDTKSLSVDVVPGGHEDGRIYAAEIVDFPVTIPLVRSKGIAINLPKEISVCPHWPEVLYA